MQVSCLSKSFIAINCLLILFVDYIEFALDLLYPEVNRAVPGGSAWCAERPFLSLAGYRTQGAATFSYSQGEGCKQV
jgi:hypothetical protein